MLWLWLLRLHLAGSQRSRAVFSLCWGSSSFMGDSLGAARSLFELICGPYLRTLNPRITLHSNQQEQAFSVCYAPGITLEKAARSIAPWILTGQRGRCDDAEHRSLRRSHENTHTLYAFWFSGFDDLRAQNIPERSVFSSQHEASCLPPVNRRARPSRARRRRRWRPLG